jgi:hypothetical protein
MKAIFSLRKHSYLKIIGTFIIAIALIAGVVGCEGEGEDEYTLTMTVNPAGAGTATDVTGASPYAEGTVVNIKAVPAAGYQFVDWTDTGVAFDDPSAEETTFAMPARDVTVTANFEFAPLDHFKCYWVDPAGGPPEEIVSLEDQFGVFNAEVRYADLFCNPTEKMHGTETTPISNDKGHLTIYQLELEEEPVAKRVEITNQFGTQNLTVYGPVKLAVPTQKVEAGGGLPCVDFEDLTVDTVFVVTDTFSDSGATMTVKEFQWSGGTWTSDGTAMVDDELQAGGSGLDINCNNVNIKFDFGSSLNGLSLLYGEYGGNLNIDINGTFQNFEDFADIDGSTIGGVDVAVTDLGGGLGKLELDGVINSFDIGGQELWIDDVCPAVPYDPPLLDHYLLYEVIESTPMDPVLVVLNDQFEGEPDALVVAPRFLANPVKKTHDDEVTDILDEDTHLVFYDIEVSGGNELDPTVDVEAKNQFGDQDFVAYLSAFLAVPSEKTVLPPPVLNHFRSYWVDPAGGIETTPVLLEDQFHAGDPISAAVVSDWFFCNPVEKWLDDWHWSPIWHPDDHLYIYGIEYAAPEYYLVEVKNQFGDDQVLTVYGPVALAVPTQKDGHEAPVDLDHYLLYTVVPPYAEVFKPVYLVDQFIEDGQEATVTVPLFFANPVQKTHGPDITPIKHPNAHLVFYGLDIEGTFATDPPRMVNNQFVTEQTIIAYYPGIDPTILGVPSVKLWWEHAI